MKIGKYEDCGHPFRVLLLVCLVEPLYWLFDELHTWFYYKVVAPFRHWAFEGDCPF